MFSNNAYDICIIFNYNALAVYIITILRLKKLKATLIISFRKRDQYSKKP